MKRVIIGLINGYRKYISPLYPACCRFYPTCSEYAVLAIKEHGAIKGSYMAIRRILRCHPLHKGGVDLVPLKKEKRGRR